MRHITSTLRLTVLTSLALSLAACSGKTDFSIPATFHPDASGGVAYTLTEPIDLAQLAPTAWKHRSKVKSLDLVALDGTVTGATQLPFTGTGTIMLRPDGGTGSTDAEAGSYSSETVSGVPHSLSVTFSQAAVSIIEDALKGNGKFTVLLKGTTTTDVQFDVDVTLHMKLTYKIP